MIIKAPVWGVDVAPLAIAYLSQMVREAGLRVQALDLNVKIYNRCHDRGLWSMDRYNEWADIGLFPKTYESLWELTEHYLKQIAAHPAPLVAFSVCTSNYLFTLETARRLKAMAPKKKVIMGGPAITNSFDVERIEPHECDYLFFGEADLEFAEIVRAVKDGREPGDVPGMVKVGTKFTYDSVHRSIVKKGVVLPTPTFEELNLDEYSGTAVPLLGSRGCVRKCTFCNDHQIYQKYRHRTAQEIFSDLEWHVVNRGAAHFTFLDLLMNGHMKVLEEFCDMVIEKGYKVAWGGQCIVRKEMTREMLEKMKRAGCQSIVYGIESFNDKVLRLMRKYYTQDLAKRVLTDTHEVGIESIINIIVGFPGEGEEEFLDTYNFVRDNREIIGQVASVSPCLVNLGSELFDRFEEFGIIFPPEGGSVKWSTKDGSSTYEQRLDRLMRVTELLASRDKHIHTVNVYDKDDRDKRLAKDDLARKSGRVADDKEGEHAMAEGLATAALATNIDGMSEEERDRYRFGAANASPRVNPQGRRAREMVENLDVGTAEMAEPAATNGTNGHGKNGTNGSTKARGEAMCDVVLALMPPWGVRFPPLSLAALAAAHARKATKWPCAI
ncbi:MAG: B12-binding domain-containing radical SAM protein [Deltaproteobacteria bacterium]|nr:B12-binding domain-containing radical SAM protein [Deltaproteobacteria bacterium]